VSIKFSSANWPLPLSLTVTSDTAMAASFMRPTRAATIKPPSIFGQECEVTCCEIAMNLGYGVWQRNDTSVGVADLIQLAHHLHAVASRFLIEVNTLASKKHTVPMASDGESECVPSFLL